MKALLDKQQFGPWALVTVGFVRNRRRIRTTNRGCRVNLVLVARREALP